MNLLKILGAAVKPYADGKKPPLHVGEVMNLWFYLSATEQTMRGEQVSYNIVKDTALKEKLKDVIENVHGPIRRELTEFLQNENVPLPKTTPEKTLGQFAEVPGDAKLNDMEVAELLSFNIMQGILYAVRGMTEAVRPDVAAMFGKYQVKKAAFAVTLKEMMSEKNWLLVPPYYNP